MMVGGGAELRLGLTLHRPTRIG